jgi:Spy/CpxP family protein refolding chaperone
MKYGRVVVVACLFAAVTIFSSAYAEGTGAAGCSGSGQAMQKRREVMKEKRHQIYEQLNLSPEQKQKLEESKQQHRETARALFEKMKASHEELNQELAKTTLDMKKIKAIQEKIKVIQSEMSDARLESILQIRKILTPEQFSTFIALTGKHRFERPAGDAR